MLRVGWLRLLARVVGAESVNRGVLATKLAELAAPSLETWLDEARLTEKPRGVFSEDVSRRLPGIAERFGIYDTEREQLTDLGRVLFLADSAYREIDSPFSWPKPLRYLGLRILLWADGDLLLEILRAWPPQGRLSRPLDLVTGAASRLLGRANDSAQADELRRLAAWSAAPKTAKSKAHWNATYPLLEPLRELGYATRVQSGGEGGQYILTSRGEALAAAVREGALAKSSADAILTECLATLFSTAEGNTVTMETSLEHIRETLVGLPDMLLGGLLSEAPLEPVVLLTEARLLSKEAATCVEVARTHALLHKLGQRTGGQVALKQGRMAWEANIAWTSPDCLEDPALFRVEEPPGDVNLLSAVEAPSLIVSAMDHPDGPSASLPSIASTAPPPDTASSSAPVVEPPLAELHAEPIATRERLLGLLRVRLSALESPSVAEAKAAEPVAVLPPPVPTTNPVRVVLWLQYVGRLLEEPTLGAPDSLSAGAPSSWIERLRSLAAKPKFLPGKRRQDPLPWPAGVVKLAAAGSPPAAYLPSRWYEQLGEPPWARSLAAAVDAWSDEQHTSVRLLTAALDRANEAYENVVTRHVREGIERFLDGEATDSAAEEDAWKAVRLLTTAWLEDLIERNLAPRADLKLTLHRHALDGLSRRVAQALFAVDGETKCMSVTHTFRVPSAMVSCVLALSGRAIEVGPASAPTTTIEPAFAVSDDGVASSRPNHLRVTVAVDASSRTLAITRALEGAWDALKKLRFLAGVSEIEEPLGIVADGAPEVIVITDGADVPGIEPFKSVARLSHAPNFPRVASSLLTMEDLIQAEHPRLSRTLHWLAAADQAGLSPAHRLSNVWVAMEHIIVEHDEEHGPAVARTLADVGALCRLEALAGYVAREICEALRRARRLGGAPHVAQELRRWGAPIRAVLGQAVHDVIYGGVESAGFTDDAALRLLLSRDTTDLSELARVIADDTPIAAFAIRYFSRHIRGTQGDLAAWLRGTRREIQSLVLHTYEIRNLVFHDGVAFGFEDASRLQNLYARFRLVVDAVIMQFAAALVRAPRREIAPGELWAKLRIGVGDLLHAADKDKRNTLDVDREALRGAVLAPSDDHR